MPEYRVQFIEKLLCEYFVEASSEDEALEKAEVITESISTSHWESIDSIVEVKLVKPK